MKTIKISFHTPAPSTHPHCFSHFEYMTLARLQKVKKEPPTMAYKFSRTLRAHPRYDPTQKHKTQLITPSTDDYNSGTKHQGPGFCYLNSLGGG